MTLYHFGNCLALIYAPYYMAYKYSGISEYGTFSRCVQAGGLYLLTQLIKMLLLATFFPDMDSGHASDMFLEVLKATVDFADLVGLYIAVNSVPGKAHAKILTAAIGWATAEVVGQRSVELWSGARGAEFSWRYVAACLAANVALLQHCGEAALLWAGARSPRSPRSPRLLPLAPLPLAPLLLAPLLLAPYGALLGAAARAALAAVTALCGLTLYARLAVH